MIDVTFDKDARLLTIRFVGVISEADLDAAAARFEELIGPAASVRIGGAATGKVLVDWERHEGWEVGAKSLGTVFTLSIRDMIRRVAIIADKRWHDEQDRIRDVCKHAEVRCFTPDARAEALAWLADD